MSIQKWGGIAAITEAIAYVFGFILFFGVFTRGKSALFNRNPSIIFIKDIVNLLIKFIFQSFEIAIVTIAQVFGHDRFDVVEGDAHFLVDSIEFFGD